ncbi:MAG: MFS transporter [Ruminococcaceae bacterium]|nr:MFS transporter [Oscillospiraceae bacterium]
MNRLTDRKAVNGIALLFAATYMVSYMTRINYGAVIAEAVTDTGFSKSLLSMAVTGSFVTYGAGQIISGIIGDRLSPKKLITAGLCVTLVMNLLMILAADPWQMLAIWCINGFAQSFMWPPMVRLMSVLVSNDDYKDVSTKVSWGSSVGTIIIYLIAPVLISISNWRSIFIFSAVSALVMIFTWNRFCPEIQEQQAIVTNAKKERTKSPLFAPVMLFVMVAIILMGMLRDGVTTWMPSYIAETYHLSNAVSILTCVVLPIFSIVCYQGANILHRKRFTNPITCAALIFAAGAVSALGLMLTTGRVALLSVLFSATLTGCMHGVNLMLIAMVPAYFKRFGNVSTASGVLNACTYIGSAGFTYGAARLSEELGWSFTLWTWFAIAVAGTAICLCSIRPWKKIFS